MPASSGLTVRSITTRGVLEEPLQIIGEAICPGRAGAGLPGTKVGSSGWISI